MNEPPIGEGAAPQAVQEALTVLPMAAPQAQRAAVTIMPGAVGAHIGVRYVADDDGALRHMHLAFHHAFEDSACAPDDALWVVPGLRDEELEDVATSARLVARRHHDGRIPYAFDKRGAHFSAEGALVLGGSAGLTCATFVLVLFEHANLHLVDEVTWDAGRSAARIDEDERAQGELVAFLEKRDAAQAKRVEGEVGCTRVRAEEVAGASGIPGHPISFARAEPAGRYLLARLQAPATTVAPPRPAE